MKIACIYFSDEEFDQLGEVAGELRGINLIWNAYNPVEAAAYQGREQPDLLIVRITPKLLQVLPVVTKELQTLFSIPFAAAASYVKISPIAEDALRKLTDDFLPVPSAQDEKLNRKCADKLTFLLRRFEQTSSSIDENNKHQCSFPIVAIGVSAGGPHAIVELLSHLPAHINGSVIIAQHIDRESARELYRRLSGAANTPFRLITHNEQIARGVIYIPASGNHFRVSLDGTFIVDNKSAHHFRPSINYFFSSLARQQCLWGTAMLLTGHGNDGAEGMRVLKENGWPTYVQDPGSAEVPSMPEAAIENHSPTGICDIPSLGNILRELLLDEQNS